MSALRTQGTELFFVSPEGSDGGEVVKVVCVTSIDGLSSPIDQVEVTCLEDQDRQYVPGLKTPGAMQFGVNFDPQEDSHVVLHELYRDNITTKFVIGLSDGTSSPTLDSDGDFDLPTDRSWITFEGYISDYPFSFALNNVVASTIGVQVSGPVVPVRKVVAP